MDSPGTCVFTATARTTTTITGSFFVYPTIEVAGVNNLCTSQTASSSICAGTYAYGVAAFGSVTSYATPAVPGAYDVASGVSYRFGCFVSVGTAATYTCAVSWVCN
jgi:hypothetical protein